jgi:uncharacterized protein (DUF302 family)
VDYAYKRVGTSSFAEIIEAVKHAVELHGFVVQRYHDIQERLASKGFPIRPLVIFEIAPADASDDEALALLMPCRINVYEEDGDIIVAALRPTLFRAVFPEHDLDDVAAELEEAVVGVVDDAVTVRG